MKISYKSFNQESQDAIEIWAKQFPQVKIGGECLYNFSYKGYHYTSIDTFWSIIRSDTFRATHVRFSNDAQEYEEGKKIIFDLLGEHKVTEYQIKKEYYVICFCKEQNLLSQWREYGNGVSIGMDFSRHSVFSIVPNEDTSLDSKENGKRNVSRKKHGIRKLIFTLPVSVFYTEQKSFSDIDLKANDALRESSDKNYSYYDVGSKRKIINSFNKIKNDYIENNAEHRANAQAQMLGTIPYIKNGYFFEEKEARLLFGLEQEFEEHYEKFTESNRINKPYVEIKYGNVEEKKEKCKYISVSKKINDSPFFNKLLNKAIEGESLVLHLIEVNEFSIYISDGSNQMIVFNEIEELCKNYFVCYKRLKSCLQNIEYSYNKPNISIEKSITGVEDEIIDLIERLAREADIIGAEKVSGMAQEVLQKYKNNKFDLKLVLQIIKYSQSEEFQLDCDVVEAFKNGYKIWCDGHWPIRSILVGPTIDKEIVKENIKRYCNSKYWLRYVDVDCSPTPYREKPKMNG